MTNDEVTSKNAAKFHCPGCSFTCSKLSNWNIHVSSKKHKKNDALTTSLFKCNCGKEYKYRQGLWAHKQKCMVTTTPPLDNTSREPANTAPAFTNEIAYVHRYPRKLFGDFVFVNFLPKTLRKNMPEGQEGEQLGNLGSPLNEIVLALVQQNKELQNIIIQQNHKFMEKIAELALAYPLTSEN